MKSLFDKKSKDRDFHLGDLVLKWEARNEDVGKHGKFDHLWFRPFKLQLLREKNHSRSKLLMERFLRPLSMGVI